MLETVDKMVLAGLGAFNMTRKRAGKVFDELVRQGQAVRGDRPGFVKDVVQQAAKARKDIEAAVSKHVHRTLAKADIASREDLERLEKKLDQALKRKARKP